jgi:uncharacterized delta-60 repeat protein
MKTFFTVFSFLFLFSQFSFVDAQYQLGEKWVARYNGTGNNSDIGRSVAVDASGSVYVTGNSYGTTSDLDFLTIKYNSTGIQQWLQRYNGSGNNDDQANTIAVDVSGNVYVAGFVRPSNGYYDYLTVKYNSSGVQQWVQSYNGPSNSIDLLYDMVIDGSGNVYVTGWSISGSADFATIKYNTVGTVAWIQRYNGTGNLEDAALGIAIDGSGNVFVTGRSVGSSSNFDYVTIKYNSSGVQQWVQRFNGSGNGNDVAYAIAVDASGNVYVTGSSTGSSNGLNYVTVKYNASGVQQWISEYIWFNNDIAYDIALGPDGSVYVTGASAGSTADDDDIYTVKYSSAGSYIWGNRYIGPGTNDDVANSIALDNNGNLYVSGYSVGIGTNIDYVLLRYSTSGGNPLTEKRYNGPGNGIDQSLGSVVDGSGCVYLTGISVATNNDYCTIKYVPLASAPVLVSPANNSTGISCTPLLNWNDVVNAETYTVQVSTNSGFTSFRVNQSGLTTSQYQVTAGALQNNVLYYWRACAVNVAGTGPWSTVWTFRTALVGIQPFSSEIPEAYELYANTPNPFNPTTDIRFDIPNAGLVTLKVFDIFGKETETIVNERLEPGKYKAVINGSNLSSGVYFYQLVTDEFTSTKKMVLLK